MTTYYCHPLCAIQISGVPLPRGGGVGVITFFFQNVVIILGWGKFCSDKPPGVPPGEGAGVITFYNKMDRDWER